MMHGHKNIKFLFYSRDSKRSGHEHQSKALLPR